MNLFPRILYALTCIGLLVGMAFGQSAEQPKAPAKILYVTSLPGTYHHYVVQREIFLEIAKDAGWDVTVLCGGYKTLKNGGVETVSNQKVVRQGNTEESRARYVRVMAEIAAQGPLIELLKKKDYAKGYDAVIYNFCLAHSNDLEAPHNIMQQTRVGGVPAFLIHCSMHSFWPTFKYKDLRKGLVAQWEGAHAGTPFPTWGDFSGIASTGHGANRPIKTTRLVDHPATIGIAAGYTTPPTELYNNFYVTPDTLRLVEGVQVHARTQKDGSIKTGITKSTIMWVTPQGKSKVMGLTIGHGNEDLNSDGFRRLLVDGVNWMIANPGPGTGAEADK